MTQDRVRVTNAIGHHPERPGFLRLTELIGGTGVLPRDFGGRSKRATYSSIASRTMSVPDTPTSNPARLIAIRSRESACSADSESTHLVTLESFFIGVAPTCRAVLRPVVCASLQLPVYRVANANALPRLIRSITGFLPWFRLPELVRPFWTTWRLSQRVFWLSILSPILPKLRSSRISCATFESADGR